LTTWLNTPIQMQFRVIDGLTVRFAQSGDRDDHALLLSPWPESLLAFEPMWARLAEHAHLVAIDLPGFGHSQRRDGLLSPRAMGEFIITVADAFGRASGAAAQPGRRQRRRGGPAPAGLAAERLGASAGSGSVPPR
jgi:pimeloyl-ACP methyl ester carboxylesterase